MSQLLRLGGGARLNGRGSASRGDIDPGRTGVGQWFQPERRFGRTGRDVGGTLAFDASRCGVRRNRRAWSTEVHRLEAGAATQRPGGMACSE